MSPFLPLLSITLLLHVLGEPLPPGVQHAAGNPALQRDENLGNGGVVANNRLSENRNKVGESANNEVVFKTKSPKRRRKRKKGLSSILEKGGDTKESQNIQKVPQEHEGDSAKGFAQVHDQVKNSISQDTHGQNDSVNSNVIQNGQLANQNAQNGQLANQNAQVGGRDSGLPGAQQPGLTVSNLNAQQQQQQQHNQLDGQSDLIQQQNQNQQQQNVQQGNVQQQNFQQPLQQQQQIGNQLNLNQQQNQNPVSSQSPVGAQHGAQVSSESPGGPPPPPPDQNNNNNNFQGVNNNQNNNLIFQQNNVQNSDSFANNQQQEIRPINVIQQQPKKEPLKIVWDWSDFLINYEQYVMPEQKVRRAPHPTTGEPWPLPQYYASKANRIFKIDKENFQFKIVKQSCDIIEKAIERYRDMVIEDTITDMYDNLQHAQGTFVEDFRLKYEDDIYLKASAIREVNVKIRRPCAKFPNDQMDESYDLFVKKTGSYIWANEVWGALRGLETFSQLVFRGPDDVLYIKDSVVNDYPRFPHRGLLIDSSRHYIFKEVIYDILEGMAQNKMNVLHWHIVDDQSFPYQSKVYPDLSEKGAYHPSFVYSQDDIADIIEYARMRGIRVMPEFDTPGHTYSWGLSHPEIMTQCYQGAHPVNGYVGPLDPSKNHTYKFLKNLFNEILHVFKDQYIHLGGDEVPMTCWSSNPDVLKLLNTLNGKPDTPINLQNNDPYMYSYDIRKVLEYYEKRLTQDLKDLGKNRKDSVRFVMWQEIMNNNVQLPNDTIIQIWQGDMGDMQRAIDMGYNTLYSTCWYLDLIEYGTKWPKYYNCDPADNTMGYQIDEKKVLGGEACLWAEYIDNENLMTTLWPRASAVAERLWSNKDVRDLEAAAKRLSEHRCRMLGRGLSVAHISGPDYCLRRGHRRDGERASNCTGPNCHPVRNVIEKFNFKMQQRGHSLADCNQLIPQGGSILTTVIVVLVLIAVFISLRFSGSRIVQIKICRNKTIFFAFVTLIAIYFMCYTSLWIQVQEFRGSFEKRIKSYGSDKIS